MKRSAIDVSTEDGHEDTLSVTPLGAGREVGRSCHLLQFRGKSVLLDCGTHPGMSGLESLPFFDHDKLDLESVDLLLVSHFHLDHAACVPYLTEKTDFKGAVWMTHPTKAVMRLLLSDFCSTGAEKGKSDGDEDSDKLYTRADLKNCLRKVNLLDYHSVQEVNGIRFWCYNAGHVLGAAMFMLEIGGVRILYTGDYSREENRHLMRAEMPGFSPDVLIVESTFGIQTHQDKRSREQEFTNKVKNAVRNKGKCLIPIFALGLAQELLLVLDEFWSNDESLHSVPVYFSSRTSSKALRVCRTYVNMMNLHIRRRMDVGNPFDLRFVSEIKGTEANGVDVRQLPGPAVVLAAPGMLQAGVSRQLFEAWCDDEKNAVMIPGYAVTGTLARSIQDRPKEITCLNGLVKPLHAAVDAVTFAAHVDGDENRKFIEALRPKFVVLVHGEEEKMESLKKALEQKFATKFRSSPSKRPVVFAPYNTHVAAIPFARSKMVKLVGHLADENAKEAAGLEVKGILIEKDFTAQVYSPKDVQEYSDLVTTQVDSTLKVKASCSPRTLLFALRGLFSRVELSSLAGRSASDGFLMQIEEVVSVVVEPANAEKAPTAEDRVETDQMETDDMGVAEQDLWSGPSLLMLRWKAGAWRDAVADSIATCALQAQLSLVGLQKAFNPCPTCASPSEAGDEDVRAKLSRPGGTWSTLPARHVSPEPAHVLDRVVQALMVVLKNAYGNAVLGYVANQRDAFGIVFRFGHLRSYPLSLILLFFECVGSQKAACNGSCAAAEW